MMFSPWDLAKSGTESGEQRAFFAFVNRASMIGFADTSKRHLWNAPLPQHSSVNWPELRWIHAIPNGGERNKASAGNMKAEGVKSGIADIFVPIPIGNFHGLYIEMKRKTGKWSDVSDNQRKYAQHCINNDYAWCWAAGWEVAVDKLLKYLSGSFGYATWGIPGYD